jgi:ribosome-associated protein
MKQTFQINGDYIELIGLLKAMGIAETGGHAKAIVEEGLIIRNGEVELRKRAKLIAEKSTKISELPSQRKSWQKTNGFQPACKALAPVLEA